MAYLLQFTSLVIILATLLAWLGQDVHRSVYLPSSVDLLTATAEELSRQLHSGTIDSVHLVKEYVRRIALDNVQGLGLHAVINLVPLGTLLETAQLRDTERKKGQLRGPLHGIPIIVKDNLITDASMGVSTTFGTYAFSNSSAVRDAFLIAKAKKAGAIILGKANLAELNGIRSDGASPGFSMAGRETISPYDGKHPCGSSSGSAVSVAAGFSPISIGSETQGSISCPASFTALYAVKPSTGFVSRTGMLPASTSFDAPGFMAKTTWDLAAMLTAVAGPDHDDHVTVDETACSLENYTDGLVANWSDMRIGFADKTWFWSIVGVDDNEEEEKKILKAGELTVLRMRDLGAFVMDDVPIPSAEHSRRDSLDLMSRIIDHEMKPGFEKVFALMTGTKIKSMADLVAFNNMHPQLAFQQGFGRQEILERALVEDMSPEQYNDALNQARIWAVEQGIHHAMVTYNLDALVTPGWSYMSTFASWSKQPALTVPLGQYSDGKPYGLTVIGRRCADHKLLQFSQLHERDFPARLVPRSMRRRRFEAYLPRFLSQYLQ